ncbi:MAG: transposase, partial [Lentisphaeria bacterium]|nr:transposase [Lentisphaeria bacterium]
MRSGRFGGSGRAEHRFPEHLPARRSGEHAQELRGALGAGGAGVPRPAAERKLGQGCIFTDDTPVRLQDKDKCREARVWTYVGGLPNAPPYHIYQFSEDRSHRHPLEFLKDFAGTIHADAFGAYEKLHADPGRPVQWAAC